MGIEEFLLDRAEKQGIEIGIEKGIEQGIEQGIEKGIEINNRETALKMIKNGLDLNLVSDITGLSIEELKKLS